MSIKGINRRKSSPHEHQQNGKVERYVRIMEEQISSMRAAAPWVPKRFVTLQILLWVHIWNLQSSANKDISRIESFTHKRPTAKYNDLPGAWGDSFLLQEPN